jgi:hypothetical protein
MFRSKPAADPKADARAVQRDVRGGKRDIEREIRHLDSARIKCEAEIRKYAKVRCRVADRGLLPLRATIVTWL